MVDVFTSEKRSEVMSKVKSAGNKTTELALIAIFRANEIKGWRRRVTLPGKPDFVFPREKVCIFADGCFWHGCPKCYRAPASNKSYWREKVRRNMARDKRVRGKLRRMGYGVLTARECDILRRPGALADKINRRLQKSEMGKNTVQ